MLILPDTRLEIAAKRAEELLKHVRALEIPYQEMSFHVTISIGVAAFPIYGPDVQSTVNAADLGLYQAKENGRNQVVVAAAP